MRRTAVHWVLLLAMLWQSVAMAQPGSTVNARADLAHATLHWQNEAHHHHEDGSYHRDDSSESVLHVVTDQLNAPLALVVPCLIDVLPPGSAAPAGRHETPAPDPALDGLLRPPRPRA